MSTPEETQQVITLLTEISTKLTAMNTHLVHIGHGQPAPYKANGSPSAVGIYSGNPKVGDMVGYHTKKGVRNYKVLVVPSKGAITIGTPEEDFSFFAKRDKLTAPLKEDGDEAEEEEVAF